jgi:hypothetical protein
MADFTVSLLNQLTRYFAVTCGIRNVADLWTRIELDSVIRYGRFRMAGDGDGVRTASLIAQDSTSRDNSYVRVCSTF